MSEWLNVKEAAEFLECSPQNIHYLIRGLFRKNAKRKKIVPPKLKKVKFIQRGKYTSYLVSREELTNYKLSLEKGHEGL